MRKFVQFIFADEVSGMRDAAIMPSDGDEAFLVGSFSHGAKLVEPKIFAIFANTFLPVKATTGAFDTYQQVEHCQ